MFRVRTRHGADADRSRTKGDDRSFGLFPYKFPLRARHTYGDGYGAPRAGHVHQGQDILANCGKRLVAARGGRVQYRGYQASGAGYYLVVDGKAHRPRLRLHAPAAAAARRSRASGSAPASRSARSARPATPPGCHLHFEMWTKPGWYEGGHAMPSVTRHLKAWDRWS